MPTVVEGRLMLRWWLSFKGLVTWIWRLGRKKTQTATDAGSHNTKLVKKLTTSINVV